VYINGGVLVSIELDLGFSSNFVVCDGRLVGVWLAISIVAISIVVS